MDNGTDRATLARFILVITGVLLATANPTQALTIVEPILLEPTSIDAQARISHGGSSIDESDVGVDRVSFSQELFTGTLTAFSP